MERIIAVDDSLSPVRDYLINRGYRVVDIHDSDFDSVSAIVVNGIDDNMMGMQETMTKAPVIEASGRTPEEIAREIESRMIGR